jgi:ATP/ADP translocase
MNFSETVPNLLSGKVTKKFGKMLDELATIKPVTIVSFYETYVQHNMMIIVLLLLFGLYLLYKYMTRKTRNRNEFYENDDEYEEFTEDFFNTDD